MKLKTITITLGLFFSLTAFATELEGEWILDCAKTGSDGAISVYFDFEGNEFVWEVEAFKDESCRDLKFKHKIEGEFKIGAEKEYPRSIDWMVREKDGRIDPYYGVYLMESDQFYISPASQNKSKRPKKVDREFAFKRR